MQIGTLSRARRIAILSPGASTLRLDTTRWALANNYRLDYDSLTVVLAAKADIGVPIKRWTEDDVWRLWWVDLSGWCSRRGLAVPDRLATTMQTLLCHLDATAGFAAGSDSIVDLIGAMRGAGALGPEPTSLDAS